MCSVAECALNYLHTGNVAVITTSVMNPMWIRHSIIDDGIPCFNPRIVHFDRQGLPNVVKSFWPYNSTIQQQMSNARKLQIYVYGTQIGQVSIWLLFLVYTTHHFSLYLRCGKYLHCFSTTHEIRYALSIGHFSSIHGMRSIFLHLFFHLNLQLMHIFQVYYAYLAMSLVTMRPAPAITQSTSEERTRGNSIAYSALNIFIQNCKDLIVAGVQTSTKRQLENPNPLIHQKGLSRKCDLSSWQKSLYTLAWGLDTRHLMIK